MKKSIITIIAFMLFALAGVAQSGERVYIRIFTGASGTAVILEKGVTKTIKIAPVSGDIEKGIIALSELLEPYFKQGFKISSSLVYQNTPIGIFEYILQKD